MPEHAVGVDEFTLVLRSSGRLDVMDWLEELDKIYHAPITDRFNSRLQELS